MTDCPTRRPQSAVRPSVRRRRRPTVPRSRANGTHRVVRAPLLDSDLWKQIYRRFTIRVLDPTAPHPHPIFLSLIWSARADADSGGRVYVYFTLVFPNYGTYFCRVLLTRVLTRRFVRKKRETRIEDG